VRLRPRVALIVACFGCAGTLGAQTHELPRELWDRPRTASVILAQESLKASVGALLAQPDARLVIHHAEGQERALEAEEIKSWLAALAIDPRRVSLRPDLAAGAAIRLEVIP
jgi:hypothetical protein